LYHTAVQSLQTYCQSRADQIRKTSVEPTEKIVNGVSQMLKKQNKDVSDI
jgi:hypothetical protein